MFSKYTCLLGVTGMVYDEIWWIMIFQPRVFILLSLSFSLKDLFYWACERFNRDLEIILIDKG